MIVTIDGPAASGKGTAASGIAARLNFEYLDTGAMYRAVALATARRGICWDDHAAVAAALPEIHIEMRPGRVLLNGEDVTTAIRAPEMSEGASKVGEIAAVREFLIPQQRKLAAGRNMVCEGRDQGTVVFPNAPVKFFITADVRVRADRRYRELIQRGIATTPEQVLEELKKRDKRDSERPIGALKQPPDAIVIDNTNLTPDELLDRLEREIRKCLPAQT